MTTLPVCEAKSGKIFDVSKWQDNNDTTYFPTLSILKSRGFRGVVIRISVGIQMDEDFPRFLAEAIECDFEIIEVYPYVDVWDWKRRGISPEAWGRMQAQTTFGYAIAQPGFARIQTYWTDVENGAGGTITIANRDTSQKVIDANQTELDLLTDKKCGNYNNQGYFFVLSVKSKARKLFMSWYSYTVTEKRIREVLKSWGYTGELVYVQVRSNGDIDGDGISDARAMGMESDGLDISVIVNESTGSTPAANEGTIEPASAGTLKVTLINGMCIRTGPGKGYGKTGSYVVFGSELPYSAQQKDLAGNLWAQINGGWICARYGKTWYVTM